MTITGTIKPLKDKHGDYIFPETSSEAVYSSDGKTIEQKIKDITIDESRLTTDKTITGAINELFTNVSNGKQLLASAITDKGVPTLATDSFETMKNNILGIVSGPEEPEILTEYMRFSGESINATHTLGKNTKNLSLKSKKICGTKDSEGNYVLKYAIDNGANIGDKRFKRYYKDIKLPYPLLGNSEVQNEIIQREDGRFEFIKRCELSDDVNRWTVKHMNTKSSYSTSEIYNGNIYYIGGYNGSSYTGEVWIYNIENETWSSGKTMPTIRSFLSSQLYNGKIYCIGGNSSGTYVPTLEIYDIETDTWTSGASMSAPRYSFSSALYNGKIYVLAGLNARSSYNSTVEIYDIATDTWSLANNIPNPLCHTCCQIHDGKIYCLYGYNGKYTNIIQIYDIENDSWSVSSATMISKRGYCGSVLYDNKIYCFGGYDGYIYTKNVEIYDILTDSCKIIGNLVTGRSSIQCSLYGDKVYCLGGKDKQYNSVIEVFDLNTNQLIECYTDLPSGYKYKFGCCSYNDKIYCVGGVDTNGDSSRLEIYDILTDTWTTGANLPFVREMSTCQIVDNKLYCIGGYGYGAGSGYNYLYSLHIYDIENNTWTEGPSMSTRRTGLTSFVYNNKIYVIGGYGKDNFAQYVYHKTIEIYDIESATWETTKITMPDYRAYHTSQLYNGKIYLIGGSNKYTTNTVYSYDIETNIWTKVSNLPVLTTTIDSQLYNGNIYCLQVGKGSDGVDRVLIYNIEKDTWTEGAEMKVPKYGMGTQLYESKIYCIGGSLTFNSIGVSSVDTYILKEIYSDHIEEIIPIEEDLNFSTYTHITNITPLGSVNPIIECDILVEI